MEPGSIRVVVVGGDRELAGRLAAELEGDGFSIETAANTRRAAQLVSRRRHHMVIFDLPASQEKLTSYVRTTCGGDRDLAVIVLSEKPSLEAVVESFQSGVADYLVKPVDLKKLCGILRRLARAKGLLREPCQEILSVVGQRLRRRRQELRLSLRHLSRRTGLSVSLISQIERARSAASVASLHKIAQALHLGFAALFEGL